MNLIARYVGLSNEFGSLFTDLLIEGRDIDLDLIRISHDHFDYMVKRSNTIITLIETGDLWDAEILTRPLMECTVKLCFICYASKDERPQLLKEYMNDLPEINQLNQSERAKKSRTIIPARDRGRMVMDGLVLADNEEERLRELWPKNKRRSLVQKWSFTEMVRVLNKRTEPMFKLDLFSAFIHSYGLSSHLIHADESGMGIVADRDSREAEEKEMMNIAHMQNLLDLTLVSSMLVTAGLSTALNIKVKETSELTQKFQHVTAYKEPVAEKLAEKWADMYSKLNA